MPGPTVLLLRHARTAWNAEGRLNSTVDLPLDDHGARHAAAVAAALRPLTGVALVRSPAERARGTAAPLEDAWHLDAEVDERLAEVDVGPFEGRTMASLADDAAFQRWRSGAPRDGYEAGTAEPLARAADRASACLDDLLARHTDATTLVVVAHGVLLRVLLCAGVLGLPPQAYRRLRLDNAHAAVVGGAAPGETGRRLAACNVPATAVLPLLTGTG